MRRFCQIIFIFLQKKRIKNQKILIMTNAIIIYLVTVNIVAFAAYGIDKLKAKAGAWRISEATLLLLAAIGGALGAWLGMQLFRHKTQHLKFKYGVPALLLAWIAIGIYFLK